MRRYGRWPRLAWLVLMGEVVLHLVVTGLSLVDVGKREEAGHEPWLKAI